MTERRDDPGLTEQRGIRGWTMGQWAATLLTVAIASFAAAWIGFAFDVIENFDVVLGLLAGAAAFGAIGFLLGCIAMIWPTRR